MPLHLVAQAALLVIASAVWASPTDPTLLLDDAVVTSGGSVRQLRVSGEFHFDDLVQVAYPFQLVVVGTDGAYVRYPMGGGAVAGVAPELLDGIDALEAQALLNGGQPALDAGLLSLRRGAMELTLPGQLPAGPLTVQLYVIESDGVVFSNVLAVTEERLP